MTGCNATAGPSRSFGCDFNPWGKRCQDMLEAVGRGEEPPRP